MCVYVLVMEVTVVAVVAVVVRLVVVRLNEVNVGVWVVCGMWLWWCSETKSLEVARPFTVPGLCQSICRIYFPGYLDHRDITCFNLALQPKLPHLDVLDSACALSVQDTKAGSRISKEFEIGFEAQLLH